MEVAHSEICSRWELKRDPIALIYFPDALCASSRALRFCLCGDIIYYQCKEISHVGDASETVACGWCRASCFQRA